MAKQTFSVGQVLTAAQMTSLQETAMGGGAASSKTANYVLVAADAGKTISMTSTSATTITVNTGLFSAGDTVFIQNLGSATCTITAGTATVNTAGSLILPQYDAGILYFVSASSAIFYDYIQVGATSPLTTKGDLYTFSTSDTRLGVGVDGSVLTAASGQATGLEWATPSSGGMTLISTTTLSGSTTTLSSIPQTYNKLQLLITGVTANTGDDEFRIALNGVTNLANQSVVADANATVEINDSRVRIDYADNSLRTDANNVRNLIIENYTSTTRYKPFNGQTLFLSSNGTSIRKKFVVGTFRSNSAITSIALDYGGTKTFIGGTALLYGVK
jgi:hypothetical protein